MSNREGGSDDDPVFAAGALCWRIRDGVAETLLVRRPRYNDVSLPKGKLDRGETMPVAALREVAEETGLKVTLGAPLGSTSYPLTTGREKYVQYWAAEVTDAMLEAQRFKANDEISGLEWLPLDTAREKLSYPHDVDIVDEFVRIHGTTPTSTVAAIVLRHGKALSRSDWKGSDASRPLQPRGASQAVKAAHTIAAWNPHRLASSPATRCAKTIAPLAKLLGRRVHYETGISQDAWDDGSANIAEVVRSNLSHGRNAVLCSHRPVIPDILREIAAFTGTPMSDTIREAAALDTAGFSLVHLSHEAPDSGILAIETFAAPR